MHISPYGIKAVYERDRRAYPPRIFLSAKVCKWSCQCHHWKPLQDKIPVVQMHSQHSQRPLQKSHGLLGPHKDINIFLNCGPAFLSVNTDWFTLVVPSWHWVLNHRSWAIHPWSTSILLVSKFSFVISYTISLFLYTCAWSVCLSINP